MKKKSILIIWLFGVIFAIFGMSCAVNASIPNKTNRFFVNDFANILSEETENYIVNNSVALDEKTTAQVVVTTVESLDGREIEDYANSLFRMWGIGTKDSNNGLLILLAPNERKVRIEVGRGLEGKINDSKAGRIIRNYGNPHFSDNKWNEGIMGMYNAVLSEVYSEYGMEVPSEVKEIILKNEEDDWVYGVFLMAAIIIFVGVFAIPIFRKRKDRKGIIGDDNYSDTWYGGFGSGSSFGGSDFGGGFFSGGGGDSGGGGASSSF